ncbi:MAG: universal stress protein [Rhodococcus sp.]|nr:universal stress protein [Rhodococcus sp. (in: high G+C Gram-positive bacteria)]
MSGNRPIVVGIDGSASAEQALSWAVREAALGGCPLSVVTTHLVPGLNGVPRQVPIGFADRWEQEGKDRLTRALEVARDVDPDRAVEITTTLGVRPPAAELVAQSSDATMLVVGANRQGILQRTMLGSVSSTVVSQAKCPVAVIRAEPGSDVNSLAGPVVVGVDGSEHSEKAVSMAFREASLRNAELLAVHAWSDVILTLAPDGGTPAEWARAAENATATLSERLAGYSAEFPEVKVRKSVVQDRPVRHLREHAETAQLLVVGRRGRGGLASMVLGSTSSALVHSAACPILVAQ